MNNYESGFPAEQPPEAQQWSSAPVNQPAPNIPPRAPRARNPRRWLAVGGVTAALLLAMGVGVGIGADTLAAHANGSSGLQTTVANFTGWQHNGGPGRGAEHAGDGLTVSSVSGDTITAKRPSGASVTVNVTSSTVYVRAGQTVNLSAITSGETIHVIGQTNSDGSITATRVEIVLPGYDGQVKSISGSAITIQDDQGTHVIHTSSSTTVTKAGQAASLSDIATGAQIRAEGTKNSDGSLNAAAINIVLPSVGGQIKTISGSTITVSNPRDTAVTTIHVTSSTRYVTVTMSATGPTQSAASFSDLKAGAHVRAEGTLNSDGSLAAQVVYIMPNAPLGPGGAMGGGFAGGHGPMHGPGDQDGDGMQYGRPAGAPAASAS